MVDGTEKLLKSEYRKLGWVLLITVLLVILQPVLWSVVQGRAEAYRQKRSQRTQIDEITRRNEAIETDLRDHQDDLSKLTLSVPEFSALTQVVERLEVLADRRDLKNLDITNIYEVTDQSEFGIVPVRVSFRVTGGEDNLLAYLVEVEHVPELTQVSSWSLLPARVPSAVALEQEVLVQYELSADTLFFLKQK